MVQGNSEGDFEMTPDQERALRVDSVLGEFENLLDGGAYKAASFQSDLKDTVRNVEQSLSEMNETERARAEALLQRAKELMK